MTTQDLKFDQANKQDDDKKVAGDTPLSTAHGLRKLRKIAPKPISRV